MNSKQYQICIDGINIILRFLIFFTISGVVLLAITKNPDMLLNILYLIPAPILSYLIGKYTKHIWSFILFHILLVVAYVLTMNHIFLVVLSVLYIIALTIYELVQRVKEMTEIKNTHIIFMVVFIGANIYCIYNEFSGLAQLFFILATTYALLYLLNMYLLNFVNYFNKHRDMANIPIQQIKSSNNLLIVFFGSICLFIMLAFTMLPLQSIVSYLGKLLFRMIKALVSLRKPSDEIAIPEEEVALENPSMGQTMPMEGPQEISPFWEMVQKAFYFVVVFAFVVGLIAVVAYGLYKLYRRFYEKKGIDKRDYIEYISPFMKRENVKSEPHETLAKRFRNIFGKTNSEKIRKHFFKAIIAHADQDQLSKELTPSQLSQYAFSKQNKLIEKRNDPEKEKQLTALYEKARYSNRECSKEETQKVKDLLK